MSRTTSAKANIANAHPPPMVATRPSATTTKKTRPKISPINRPGAVRQRTLPMSREGPSADLAEPLKRWPNALAALIATGIAKSP